MSRTESERDGFERCLNEIERNEAKKFWQSKNGIRRTKEDAERAKEQDRRIREHATVRG